MKKMGFWEILALVLGAQVGSGILILPTELAPFGMYTIAGWALACLGAISLAFVFSDLCSAYPKTGGPSVYVNEAFGKIPAFFTGWTYWLVSWVSTSIVVIACIGYLSPFFTNFTKETFLNLELILLFIITLINCLSVILSGKFEFLITLMKFIPLIIIPGLAFCNFDISNFKLNTVYQNESSVKIISECTLMAFWGFIGIECATTPAGTVENPKKNIPLAIIFGTMCAAFLYFINCLGIMGAIDGSILEKSVAPFVVFIENIIPGNLAKYTISIIGFIICLGTLNAWTLTSGQIALGMAENKLLPTIFGKTNKNKAPIFSIIISSLGIAIILILTMQDSVAQQLKEIIDFSVISFLGIYLISSISYMKLIVKKIISYQALIGFGSCIFCTYVIACSTTKAILIASLFTLSGIFIYPIVKNTFRTRSVNTNE